MNQSTFQSALSRGATRSRPTRHELIDAKHFQVWTPDGLTLAAQTQGHPDAPEVLFVHGLGQSHLSWTRQLNDPDLSWCRLVTFDLRGHGHSDKPSHESAYCDGTRWADDIAAVIVAARLRNPVLVGWSLGGLMILHYLKRHGGRNIAGINLVNAVTAMEPDLVRPGPVDFSAGLASEDLGVRADAVATFLRACFAVPPPEDEFNRMLVYNGMVPRALHQGIFKMSSVGCDEALARFSGPLTVTYGELDAFLCPEMAQRVCRVNPRAVFSLYPEAGHSPFYEAPVRFNQELLALLNEAA